MTVQEAIQRVNLKVNENSRQAIVDILKARLSELEPCISEADSKGVHDPIIEELRAEANDIRSALTIPAGNVTLQNAWTAYRCDLKMAFENYGRGFTQYHDIVEGDYPQVYTPDITIDDIYEYQNDIQSL